MAFDAFIKIATIPGESTDDKHAGWIELLSYSFGCSQSGSGQMSATGAQSGGRADFQDFSFTHLASKASPKLMAALANGAHIDEINIELCRATGEKQKFYEYKFTKCMFSSYQQSGSQGGDDRPVETVSFRFSKVEVTYYEFDNQGKPKGKVAANWDLALNKGG